MQRPLLIRRITLELARSTYDMLLQRAPRWLEVCGFEVFEAFAVWALGEPVFLVEIPDGVVFVTDWRPRLCARVHPVVWGNKTATGLVRAHEVLLSLARECNVTRVEVLVPCEAPRGLSRWCKRAGLSFEGTLRHSCLWRGKVVDGDMHAIIVEV